MVNSIVKKSLGAFTAKQTNIFSAAFFIILTTILSQLLGVFKYRLLVHYFTPQQAGVFLASFRIPDFLSALFIGGAIISSFIPIFAEYLRKDEKIEGFKFASSLLTFMIGIYLIISLFVIFFAFPLARFFTPGKGFSEADWLLMSQLLQVIQLVQLFFIIGTVISAILQSFQLFLLPGIATSFYNLGIIIGIIIFAPQFGLFGATIGVLLGSILFCMVQIPFLYKTGFHFSNGFTFHPGVKRFIGLMSPTMLSVIVTQLAITANLAFTSFISPKAYFVFDISQTLITAPVLLFGQSIAQAAFPALALKSQERKEFLAIFTNSFNLIMYLILPISAILIVLRIPTVRLVYGAQKFDWPATVDTGLTVSYFAISLFAQSLMYLLSRAFYALKDTKTPFIITTISVIINIAIAYLFILVYQWPIYSLALAFSIANILSFFLMVIYLDRKVHLPKFEMIVSLGKICIAAIVMGAALYIPIKLLDQLVFDTTHTINLIILTGIASFFGFISYIFFTWLLDIREAYYIINVAKSFGGKNNILKQIGELIDGSRVNP